MNGPPVSLYRTADIRAMDHYAIETLGVDGYVLMTRAAQASLNSLQAMFPRARNLLVVCGAGNNAGDGYVLARLAMDLGWNVVVTALSNPAKLHNDAGHAWRDFVAHGGQTQHFEAALLQTCDVVVDALLGTGLTRDVEGEFAEAIHQINLANAPVVSLDVPSGLNSDTGQPQPVAVRADLTTTFIAQKIGLYSGRAAAFCGHIECHTLDLPDSVASGHTPVAQLLSERDARACLPRRAKDAHKGVHGRVLIVGGNVGMSGAVVLAATAALRSGAGTVTVACHPHNRTVVASQLAELMCVGVQQPEELDVLLERSDVLAIGPGLGRDEWGRRLFAHANQSSLPAVIDADGLRCLAAIGKQPPVGARVLTPHAGEAAALLAQSSQEVVLDRTRAAHTIAVKFGTVVVLKGADSVVAAPDGQFGICAQGNPGMATAGSGDVLTGIAAGIWAQQKTPEEAAYAVARAAVFVHARAGDLAALEGERGLMASDIIGQLRACVNFD